MIEEDRHLGVMVKGLTQVEVKSPEEIFAIIARSKHNRRTAEVRKKGGTRRCVSRKEALCCACAKKQKLKRVNY